MAGLSRPGWCDEAMIFVLSSYENINLDALQSTRAGSKWTTDPDHIRRRQERAHSFIQYAPIHQFIDGPVPSDDEAEEEVGTDEEEDEEEADEEIQADTPPDSATGAATEPTAEETATETPASPSADRKSVV